MISISFVAFLTGYFPAKFKGDMDNMYASWDSSNKTDSVASEDSLMMS